ncbi:MAG: MOSC domain-containing protein [Phycisphaerae bacterium]|nr:MOSC domain-containing protein [Phycisphaerae bacterium]NNF41799.1 MOSC domain-containing protein [Phycisphaerales bacterium]
MRLPQVLSVNVSAGGIPKRGVDRVAVTPAGLDGDAHDHDKHNTPLQAVSLIDVEDLEDLCREGFPLEPGSTGENVTVRGLDVDRLDVGDRLRLSGGVELELTKRRKPCYVLDAIDPELKTVIVGRCGFYARVLTPGTLTPGETIEVEPARAEPAPTAP